MKNKEQNQENQLGDLFPFIPAENEINLKRCVVDRSEASEEIFAVNHYLRLYDEVINGSTPVEIIKDASKFVKLYTEAMKLYNNEPNYITALRIRLTADEDIIRLVYQPILLLRSTVLNEAEKIVQYNIAAEGNDFIYDNASRDFIPMPAIFNTYPAKYKANMSIIRNEEENHTRYIQGIDTEAVIFSFQEISTMISDNPAAKRFFIFNCIKTYSNDPVASIRNSLMLSPNLYPGDSQGIGPFYKMYGNLAHLCPPNCNTFFYKLKAI